MPTRKVLEGQRLQRGIDRVGPREPEHGEDQPWLREKGEAQGISRRRTRRNSEHWGHRGIPDVTLGGFRRLNRLFKRRC